MNWVSALDPATGRVLWEYKGTRDYQHPSPVTDGETVYAMTYLKTVALRPGGAEAWAFPAGSTQCTPVSHAGHLYWADEQGMAYCVDARTGKSVYRERLAPAPGRIDASGVLAGGRLYYVSRTTGTYVVAASPEYELLAHNRIEDDGSVFNGSPAVEDGRLYPRSDRYLYCVGTR
jgi:outer membrane protein assembly factor BamB